MDKDAYYVFLVDGVQTSLSGFMPFKRQYGYIFNNTEAQTIAHELGHGAFCLRHTFSDKAFIANQGDTDNLMDYSGSEATKLYKHQWDNVHNPEKMVGWFEDDAESALGVLVNNDRVQALVDSLRATNKRSDELFISSEFIDRSTYTYKGTVTINEADAELLVEHWYYNGEHQINPSENYSYEHPSKKNTSIFEFSGSIANGDFKPLLKIYTSNDKFDMLEQYLFGDDTLRIEIVTTLIAQNQKNTFSSFTIDGDSVSGFFIERESGTTVQERTAGFRKRIPENEYDVVENDCATGRSNCANEFTLVTTSEKSGTRGGILIHKGINYESSTGCLITCGTGYNSSSQDFLIDGALTSLDIYDTNGTSGTTLTTINNYIERRKQVAEDQGKVVKITIDINRL